MHIHPSVSNAKCAVCSVIAYPSCAFYSDFLKVSRLHHPEPRWAVKMRQCSSERRWQLQHSVTPWVWQDGLFEDLRTTHWTLAKRLSCTDISHRSTCKHTSHSRLTDYHTVRYNTSIFSISHQENLMTGWGVSDRDGVCVCVCVCACESLCAPL